MIRAMEFWNEPNNLSHWDFHQDPAWEQFARMTRLAADAVHERRPALARVLGGISPIDAGFIRLMDGYGLLARLDAVAVHGFPLDWNHWQIDEWPDRIDEIRAATSLPIWVTEVGASTFGADEVQVFGLQRTADLLLPRVENVFWCSLLDLLPARGSASRHQDGEGGAYFRRFHMGLIRADGTLKPAADYFNPAMGICQWFHFEDPRLEFAVQWLKRLGVKKVRTGISWADWHRRNSRDWFDRQMEAMSGFDITVTLCFTPLSRGRTPHYTSPPRDPEEFAWFACEVADRYAAPCPGEEQPRPDPRTQTASSRSSTPPPVSEARPQSNPGLPFRSGKP